MSHIGQGDEPLERPVPDGWPGYVSPALRALPHLWPESIVQFSCTEPVTAHLVQPDVDCVHADVLRVNLQQENQLLQLPGGTGRELKQQTICIN